MALTLDNTGFNSLAVIANIWLPPASLLFLQNPVILSNYLSGVLVN